MALLLLIEQTVYKFNKSLILELVTADTMIFVILTLWDVLLQISISFRIECFVQEGQFTHV